jgi:xylulokinase
MKYVLGVDLGTSGVKALLLNKNGNVADVYKVSFDIEVPKKGYAEQSPQMWKDKTFKAINHLLEKSKISPSDIEMVGLSGQMHGVVLLDKDNRALRSGIIWSDQRAVRQVEYINNSIGKIKLGEMTSNPVSTGFFAVTLMWIKENEPEIYNKINIALLPKDYIRYELTGKLGTETTDASGTGIFDVSVAKWNYQLIEFLGIRKDILPECYKSYEIAGNITEEASIKTGLMEGTPVVFGASDHSLSALGNGIINTGTLAINIGTGGQIYTPIQLSTYDRNLRMNKFCHVIPGTWNIIGATMAAGLSLKWFLKNVLNIEDYEFITQISENSVPGSEGVIFVPYISGERTPHLDSSATGMFFGLTLKHKQAELVRAVMEGVIYSFKDCYDIFLSMGLRTNRLIASGGGATNRLWRQIIADVFETKVYTSENSEEAATGAAMLAGIGSGMFDSFEDACDKCIKISSDIVYPNSENSLIYKRGFEKYRELYHVTKHMNNV